MAETSIAVADILKRHPELEQIDVAQYLPVGLDAAVRDKSLSLWTQRHSTDAMFLALFRQSA
jgi:16S rRNA (cytosine967-C5)-methyltransferase